MFPEYKSAKACLTAWFDIKINVHRQISDLIVRVVTRDGPLCRAGEELRSGSSGGGGSSTVRVRVSVCMCVFMCVCLHV